MLPIPPGLQAQFEEHLKKTSVPEAQRGLHKKWLRYYLDFCRKYDFLPTQGGELAPVYSEIAGQEADGGATEAGCEGGMTMTLKEAKSPLDF
jgi:hypothetical protein